MGVAGQQDHPASRGTYGVICCRSAVKFNYYEQIEQVLLQRTYSASSVRFYPLDTKDVDGSF
jgi:hypothetical protein